MSLMPALFVGHGSPMNALEENEFTKRWRAIAQAIPRPRAIICISAHWTTQGTFVAAAERPKTIHDFYGFPDALNRMEYPAKGAPSLAQEIQQLIKSTPVELDEEWGLDHGAWSVLVHMYPQADIPVLQLSLDRRLSLRECFALGQELRTLREHGILLLGTGNIVHNLRRMDPSVAHHSWAAQFDAYIKEKLQRQEYQAIIHYLQHPAARLAVPEDEHYRPLLYIIGASQGETPRIFNDSIVYGSISMTSVAYGEQITRAKSPD